MGQLPKDKRKDEQPAGGGSGFRPRAMIIWLLIAIAVVATIQLLSEQSHREEQGISELYALLEQGKVEAVRIEAEKAIVKLDTRQQPAGEPDMRSFFISMDYKDELMENLKEYNETAEEKGLPIIEYGYYPQHWLVQFSQAWLPWLLMLALLWFLLTRMMRGPGTGGVLAFGKSRARLQSDPAVRALDVFGNHQLHGSAYKVPVMA